MSHNGEYGQSKSKPEGDGGGGGGGKIGEKEKGNVKFIEELNA